MMEMEDQLEQIWKEKVKEQIVREMVNKGTQSAPETRRQLKREQGTTSTTQSVQ